MKTIIKIKPYRIIKNEQGHYNIQVPFLFFFWKSLRTYTYIHRGHGCSSVATFFTEESAKYNANLYASTEQDSWKPQYFTLEIFS